MTKTKEELNQIKQSCQDLTEKLKELSQDELDMVTGGAISSAQLSIRPNLAYLMSANENLKSGSNIDFNKDKFDPQKQYEIHIYK